MAQAQILLSIIQRCNNRNNEDMCKLIILNAVFYIFEAAEQVFLYHVRVREWGKSNSGSTRQRQEQKGQKDLSFKWRQCT